jgi:protein-L-isoaspartate(D-aspartate) O-methyltransferase
MNSRPPIDDGDGDEPDGDPMDAIEQGKIELIMALRRQGIRDKRVLSALERIPREIFINASYWRSERGRATRPPFCRSSVAAYTRSSVTARF